MSDQFEAVSIGIQNAFSLAGSVASEQAAHVGFEMTRPSVLFRPALSVDGNQYCALYGDDLVQGCAGFGNTPAEAMTNFDKNWSVQKPPRVGAAQ